MSTKTTFKRVALVAVASLGFGMVSAVSANAAAITAATYTSTVTNSTNTGATTAPIPAGTALTANLKLTTDEAGVAADTGTMTFTVTAGPASKNITSTCTFAATTATISGLTSSTVTAAATGTFTIVLSGAAALAAEVIGTVSCPTTIGGAYVITPTGALTTPAVTPTLTAVTATVSGGNISQGLTRSTTTGTASVGGASTAIFTLPTHTNAQVPFTITSSGVGSMVAVTATGSPTVSNVNGTNLSAGAKLVPAADTALIVATVETTSTEAGVQTLTLNQTNATTGVVSVITTLTITYGSVAGISAAFTSAGSFIGNGNTRPSANATTGLSYPRTAGVALAAGATTGATIAINVFDSANVALVGQAISATIAGPGLIKLETGTSAGATGTARAASLTASAQASASQSTLGISGDGTAGTAVITISSGSTVLFTKTVTFYGTVAKLVATQNLSVARASSTAGGTLGTAVAAPAGTTVATTPAVTIEALDSNGNVVTGLTITMKSSDTSIIGSGSVVESDGTGLGDGYAGPGYYNASVTSTVGGKSGATTTVVFRTLLSDGVTYVTSEPLTFTLGGSAATGSFSMALDKATYSVGDAAVLTVTAKDSSGNPVFDQNLDVFGGLGSAPVFSKSVVGLTPSGTAMFISGKKTYKGYVSSLPGTLTATGTTDSLSFLTPQVLTVSVAVTGPTETLDTAQAAADAAAEATDAANAATDAANAAAEAADAATAAAQDAADAVAALATSVEAMVNALKKQITALTNLVIKIQKKVRA